MSDTPGTPGIHRCTCGGTLVALDVPMCNDQQHLAHQCSLCKMNDRAKALGPYVYDMLSYCMCAVCSRLTFPRSDRAVLEREVVRLVLGELPAPDEDA